MSKKFVFMFSEGNETQRELLGGKGANLAGMTNLGMPVPPGFIVSTEACAQYTKDGKAINEDIKKQIFECMERLEKQMNKKFGDPADPLLVAVRSGSRASMPGMMDTILNLGLNDQSVEGLAKKTGNPRFAYDSYRRFIQMFSDVVMEQKKEVYEHLLKEIKNKKGVKHDTELTADDLKEIVKLYKDNYKKNQGKEFPQDPKEQLIAATKAVFRSWDNPRANTYRFDNGIPYEWGTAVNIQSMVFGNKGETSGSGVAFSRNPSTGEKVLYGEYLMNCQGEDVVAGIRTPMKISALEQQNPQIYKEFVSYTQKLEKHYKFMQDMEFTIEEGKLYMLQTRNGKCTAAAALRIAVDLVKEGMIDEKQALCGIDPKLLDALLHPQFVAKDLAAAKPIGKGLDASPGAAAGKIVFTAEAAVEWNKKGEKVVLVRSETSPEDIEGMKIAQGILTSTGGNTSHAAVVARAMGICCVVGCGELFVDEHAKKATLGGKTFNEGDVISLNGSTGQIYDCLLPTQSVDIPTLLAGDFGTIMKWTDKYRAIQVRTNADTPADTKQAVGFGAEGIGLTRTEHMFFEADRIMAMREMIVAKTVEARKAALSKLLPMQKKDFKEIYLALEGKPATIRFLDPPLHEFVPHSDDDIKKLAKELKITFEELKNTVESLREFNPMLGHRGLRLAVTYPEIAEMQTTAVIEAALEVNKEKGWNIVPEIMIPLVCEVKELKYVKDYVVKTADAIIAKSKQKLTYQVGTMIEIPRACILANKIAEEAEFFSFGTNDLTQMTFGFSRDDAGKFLDYYYNKKIFEFDPFGKIDFDGVGELVKMAVEKGKSVRKNLKIGICGEHGGDPESVVFCHNIGLSYVSCSPYRVPIARLAAAQANIKNPRK
ncbi:MAG: pyruvate, phosphate dikinase [Firmicutes bacterium]|nr:pyruvate, phosphate dikinase [Bacillota bacterium]